MRNLAGNHEEADEQIRRELERARVSAAKAEPHFHEVPYTIMGKLGEFEFTRAWTYWVVDGPVPLEVAEELFADPVGRTDIRATGDAGCRPPSEWTTWLTPDGHEVAPTEQEAPITRIRGTIKDADVVFGHLLFSDDPASLGATQFVTSYHIDSEVGLRVFVDALRAHDLVKVPILG